VRVGRSSSGELATGEAGWARERRVRERGTVGPTCQHKSTGGGGVSLASLRLGERILFCLFRSRDSCDRRLTQELRSLSHF
jgi:hypothetical protein